MMKKNTLWALVLTANCEYKINIPINTPFNDNNGKPIIIEETYDVAKAETSWDEETDTYYISYNPGWLRKNVKPEAQNFVFFHELGHIRLGHLNNDFINWSQEEADCYSLNYLRKAYHYGEKEYKIIEDFIENELNSVDRKNYLRHCE